MSVKEERFDDFDGETKAAGTRRYNWDGRWYEIDLHEENLINFDDTMKQYVEVSREIPAPEPAPAARRSGKMKSKDKETDRSKRTDIRNWATAKGIQIGARGRIADDIIRQYEAEMANA